MTSLFFKYFKTFFKSDKNITLTTNDKVNDQNDTLTDSDPIDIIVKDYLSNKFIDIPLVPQYLEKEIYKSILHSVFDMFEDNIRKFEVNVFNQKIVADLKLCIIDSLLKNKNKSTIDCVKYEDNVYITNLVKSFMKTDQVKISVISKKVQFNFYKNLLLMVFAIIMDTLKCMSMEIMGQKFTLVSIPLETKDNSHIKNNTPISFKDDPAIDQLVDEIMAKHNVFLIPDFIERHLYKCSFTIVFYFFANIVNDTKISVLHHIIDLQFKQAT